MFDNGSWEEQDKVKYTDGASGDHFGRSVAINEDGDGILVGANLTDINMQGYDIGTAYFFRPVEPIGRSIFS